MDFNYSPNYCSKEEELLIEQYRNNYQIMLVKHYAEISDCMKNNADEQYLSEMRLRHTSELINLFQVHLNSWIDLLECQRLSLSRSSVP